MPVDERPGSTELIDLAEASLVLGDAEAALQLLAQVDEDHRDNRWLATQVEALRCHGDFDACHELATTSLEHMICEADWGYARRVLVECGRVLDELFLGQESIEFLHQLVLKVRNLPNLDLLFKVQLFALLASRIAFLGDADTADQIMSMVDSDIPKIADRRAQGSLLWVRSDISAAMGNLHDLEVKTG